MSTGHMTLSLNATYFSKVLTDTGTACYISSSTADYMLCNGEALILP